MTILRFHESGNKDYLNELRAKYKGLMQKVLADSSVNDSEKKNQLKKLMEALNRAINESKQSLF